MRRYPSLAVTMKGELLAHLGVKPGERIELDKLPGDELRVKAAQSAGTIDSFRHAGKAEKPLTIDEVGEVAEACWAGGE